MYFYGLVFAISKPAREPEPKSLSYGKQSLDGAVFLYGPFFVSFLLHRQVKENIVRRLLSSRDICRYALPGSKAGLTAGIFFRLKCLFDPILLFHCITLPQCREGQYP